MYWYDKKVLSYLWVPWTNLFVRAKDDDMNQQRRGTVQCFSGCGNVPFSIPCIGQKRGTDKQVCPWHPLNRCCKDATTDVRINGCEIPWGDMIGGGAGT